MHPTDISAPGVSSPPVVSCSSRRGDVLFTAAGSIVCVWPTSLLSSSSARNNLVPAAIWRLPSSVSRDKSREVPAITVRALLPLGSAQLFGTPLSSTPSAFAVAVICSDGRAYVVSLPDISANTPRESSLSLSQRRRGISRPRPASQRRRSGNGGEAAPRGRRSHLSTRLARAGDRAGSCLSTPTMRTYPAHDSPSSPSFTSENVHNSDHGPSHGAVALPEAVSRSATEAHSTPAELSVKRVAPSDHDGDGGNASTAAERLAARMAETSTRGRRPQLGSRRRPRGSGASAVAPSSRRGGYSTMSASEMQRLLKEAYYGDPKD